MGRLVDALAAGVGRADITPAVGAMLEGYHRPGPSSGVLDPLFATVLVLSSAFGPVALVTVDHVGLAVPDALRIRERSLDRALTDAERSCT